MSFVDTPEFLTAYTIFVTVGIIALTITYGRR